MVSFAIPESRRSARDALRDQLFTLGGAAVQPGVYLSPHRWDAEIAAEAERLGIEEHVATWSTDDLALGTQRDPRTLAAQLWPLDEVAAHYEAFIETYQGVPEALERLRREGRRIAEDDFLAGVLHIAVRFNECFERDPLLPPELLPRPWPGRAARQLLAQCRRQGALAREQKQGPPCSASSTTRSPTSPERPVASRPTGDQTDGRSAERQAAATLPLGAVHRFVREPHQVVRTQPRPAQPTRRC